MIFHHNKCKLLSINNKNSPLAIMPFFSINYSLGSNIISYADIKRDLGMCINESFSYNDHCESLITKSKQQVGIYINLCMV